MEAEKLCESYEENFNLHAFWGAYDEIEAKYARLRKPLRREMKLLRQKMDALDKANEGEIGALFDTAPVGAFAEKEDGDG